MGMSVFSEEAGLFYALVFAVLFLLVVVACALLAIVSKPEGRLLRARHIANMYFRRAAFILIFGIAAHYWMDAHSRSKASDCRRTSSQSGHYVAELCTIHEAGDQSTYVGRVYAANKTRLVERTFSTPVPEIAWNGDNDVSFSRGGDEAAFVRMPPSTLDQWRAKLP